MIQLEVGLWFN